MAKDPSPLLGYNNNIRHKNRVFHIQTEDSGVRHPHIITHLFMDGGRILKSVKTSYAEHLGVDKMADLVRKMMKDQHKGMLIALRDGQFDAVIDGGEAPKPAAKAPPPAPPLEPVEPVAPERAVAAQVDEPPPPSVAPARVAPASVRPLVPPPQPPPEFYAADEDMEEAAATVANPVFEAPLDLQPPPANLFRPRTGGNYSAVGNTPAPSEIRPSPTPGRPNTRPPTNRPGVIVSKSPGLRPSPSPGSARPSALASGAPAPRQPPIRRTSSLPPPQAPEVTGRAAARRPAAAPAAVARPSEHRYGSARPAAIFGQARPRGGSSIFGEDIISDKSLDEVILSYLAEDVGPASPEPAPKSSTGNPSDPKRRR